MANNGNKERGGSSEQKIGGQPQDQTNQNANSMTNSDNKTRGDNSEQKKGGLTKDKADQENELAKTSRKANKTG